MNTDMKLKNRIALITGGGRGIGRAIGLSLLARERGWCWPPGPQQVEDTAAEIGKDGTVLPVVCDVSDVESVELMFERISVKFGRGPDVLVNNAGIAERYAGKDRERAVAPSPGDQSVRNFLLYARCSARDD